MIDKPQHSSTAIGPDPPHLGRGEPTSFAETTDLDDRRDLADRCAVDVIGRR